MQSVKFKNDTFCQKSWKETYYTRSKHKNVGNDLERSTRLYLFLTKSFAGLKVDMKSVVTGT